MSMKSDVRLSKMSHDDVTMISLIRMANPTEVDKAVGSELHDRLDCQTLAKIVGI